MTTPEPVAAAVIEVLRETIQRHTPDTYTSTPGEGP